MITSSTGCSLFVMAGKAVFGDPRVPSQLKAATGKDLSDGEDALLIICSAPHRLLTNFQSLQIDIVDRVSRNLEARNVKVVPSGDVATWYDDHGEWGDYSELAGEFDARYILHIEVREFDYRVPESENLMQGKAEGRILVHEVNQSGTQTAVLEQIPVRLVFDTDFSLTFPTSYPVPREKRSEDMFQQGFLDRLAQHLSQHLYDYRMSESIH
ncbi:MAG: hypothetical protein GY903_04895 [Fuerstiella sp.]|nr:hypothetical protein [Fuerstiella sp.]MCP4853811.1 hypothetical protein [Fuerstiella sp.]